MGSGSSKNRGKIAEVKKSNTVTVTEKQTAELTEEDNLKMFKAYKAECQENATNKASKVVSKNKASSEAGKAEVKNTQSAPADPLPWRQALDEVAVMEIWDGLSRSDRSPWKRYFQRADDLMKKPRKCISKDVVSLILEGDLSSVDISSVPNAQPKVVVFVSSTFTDTKAERNHLMKDVYPFLRDLCRRLGVDFGTVDMRWGVTEESTLDHSTVDMCVSEIHRCIKDSVGPAFLCLLGHKYGYQPLPAQIEKSELETLLHHMQQTGQDTGKINEYYTLDDNAVPPNYVLKPRTKDNKSWWTDVKLIQDQLREGSVACFGAKNKKCDKYNISVTETEIHNGAFENPNARNQVAFIRRDLED